jgi:hypothetical protein
VLICPEDRLTLPWQAGQAANRLPWRSLAGIIHPQLSRGCLRLRELRHGNQAHDKREVTSAASFDDLVDAREQSDRQFKADGRDIQGRRVSRQGARVRGACRRDG